MEARELQLEIATGKYDDLLLDIYVDEAKITYQKQRYTKAIEEYVSVFGNEDVEIYSAPGMSMPFLFCMFSPFKKCSFLVKKILLIKQCIDSFLFFFHEFFPFF